MRAVGIKDAATRVRHRLSDTSGQVLPLGALFILALLLPLLGAVGEAEAVTAHAGAQAAVDAAALAGAQKTTVTKKVDAIGNIYAYSVSIDPSRAATAAAQLWQANTGLLLGASTQTFQTAVNNNPAPGAPATFNVAATLSFPDPMAALIGMGRTVRLSVQSVAGSCGATSWPGDVSPWCSQQG